MRKILLSLFVLALCTSQARSVTVVKAVGHGDCYAVIADGRVVVIDAGPGNSAGLLTFLKSGYLHYDRIIITHVHSDHAGGLISVARFAQEEESPFTADAFVSNHGEHDLDLIIKEANISSLLKSMRGRKPVAVLTEEGLNSLALNDPHLRVEAIQLQIPVSGNENQSGLIVKVTEIREGESRATLFLGDIEASRQRALFSDPRAAKVFENVRAVTLPHHGRKATLAPEFFRELKRLAGNQVTILHSDQTALDPEVRNWAQVEGVKVVSTTDSKGLPHDLQVNLFSEPNYYVVKSPTTLRSLTAHRRALEFKIPSGISNAELAAALSSFTGRSVDTPLSPGTTISVPTEGWIKMAAEETRRATVEENNNLITQLGSDNESVARRAATALSIRVSKLTSEQIDRMRSMIQDNPYTWSTDLGHPPDCPHKIIYRDRTTKYYVGKALARRPSALGPQGSREVSEALRDGIKTRIWEDPNWT